MTSANRLSIASAAVQRRLNKLLRRSAQKENDVSRVLEFALPVSDYEFIDLGKPNTNEAVGSTHPQKAAIDSYYTPPTTDTQLQNSYDSDKAEQLLAEYLKPPFGSSKIRARPTKMNQLINITRTKGALLQGWFRELIFRSVMPTSVMATAAIAGVILYVSVNKEPEMHQSNEMQLATQVAVQAVKHPNENQSIIKESLTNALTSDAHEIESPVECKDQLQPEPCPEQPQPGPSPEQSQPGQSPDQSQPGPSPDQPQPGPSPEQPQPGPSPEQPQPG